MRPGAASHLVAALAAAFTLSSVAAGAGDPPAGRGENPATETSASEAAERVIGRVRVVRQKTEKRQDGRTCEVARPVGSHIPRELCRTPAERARDRAEARQRLREAKAREGRSPGR